MPRLKRFCRINFCECLFLKYFARLIFAKKAEIRKNKYRKIYIARFYPAKINRNKVFDDKPCKTPIWHHCLCINVPTPTRPKKAPSVIQLWVSERKQQFTIPKKSFVSQALNNLSFNNWDKLNRLHLHFFHQKRHAELNDNEDHLLYNTIQLSG